MEHDIASGCTYGVHMRDETAPEGGTFATFVREARSRRGWTQEKLIEETGISRSTIIRWENGSTQLVGAENVREVCAALEADPREAVVALGYLTRDELGLGPAEAPLDHGLRDAAKLLASPDVPPDAKESLRTLVRHAVGFTVEALGIRKPRAASAPKEPSAAERGIKPARR